VITRVNQRIEGKQEIIKKMRLEMREKDYEIEFLE